MSLVDMAEEPDFEDLDFPNIEEEKTEEGIEEEQELSYQEIYSSLLLNDEIQLTVSPDDLEKLKVGLKNVKAKTSAKNKELGLPTDTSVLKFISKASDEFEGFIDLTITVDRKGTVKVKKVRIPDDSL